MSPRQSLSYAMPLPPLEKHPAYAPAALVLAKLTKLGHLSAFAGGCVRDALLAHTPKDLDIATAAPPEVVEQIFPRTLAVGKAFGTIVVIEDGHNFEVTTFRKDGPYADGRHPIHVEFSDMKEDAWRRDFTVNALFYDPEAGEVVDHVGGVADLAQGLLRTVGHASERFSEDRLRMLRAARFVAQLGFRMEDETADAIRAQYQELEGVAKERIFNELKRLLESEYITEGLRTLRATHLSRVIWPELDALNLERFVDFVPPVNWQNAFAAVALLVGAKNVEERLQSWKVPRQGLKSVLTQIHDCKVLMNPASSRADRARVLGGDQFLEILRLADGFLPGNPDILTGWITEFLSITGKTATLPHPLFNGHDLLKLGVEPGEKMGEMLKVLYAGQLEGQFASKAEALKKIQAMIKGI